MADDVPTFQMIATVMVLPVAVALAVAVCAVACRALRPKRTEDANVTMD